MCVLEQLNGDCLLEILQRMDVEDIAQMFLISMRFHNIIRRYPNIFLKKRPSGKTVWISSDLPKMKLRLFFLYFGDCIHRLEIDHLNMYAANLIVGYCDDLQYVGISTGEMSAVHFLNELMPQVQCVVNGIPLPL